MPRRPRLHYPGAVYHALARGVNRGDIFLDDSDRHAFLGALRTVRSETPFSLLAYCLMGNHFHFAIRTGQNSLAAIMQRLLTMYSRTFNRRYGREGHLFQARYKAYLCTDDRYLIALIRYIHQNPVRAGICRQPGDWPWSSYRAIAGYSAPALLVDVASVRQLAPDVSETAVVDPGFQPWPVEGEPLLLRAESERRSLEAIALAVTAGSVPSGMRSAQRTEQRRAIAREALAEGHTLTDVAKWMGCSVSAAHRWIRNEVKVKT